MYCSSQIQPDFNPITYTVIKKYLVCHIQNEGGRLWKNWKKIVASAWVWTHIILGKQKVDEFSPKALPLSYGSTLQMMTAYYLYIKIWIFLYSILFIHLQETKNEAKMLISWKILAELSLVRCISTLYSSWTPKKLSKLLRIKIDLNLRFEWCVTPVTTGGKSF